MMALTPFAFMPAAGEPPFDAEADARALLFRAGALESFGFVGSVPPGFTGSGVQVRFPWHGFEHAGTVVWRVALRSPAGSAEARLVSPSSPGELITTAIVVELDAPLRPGDPVTLTLSRDGTDPADTLPNLALVRLELLEVY